MLLLEVQAYRYWVWLFFSRFDFFCQRFVLTALVLMVPRNSSFSDVVVSLMTGARLRRRYDFVHPSVVPDWSQQEVPQDIRLSCQDCWSILRHIAKLYLTPKTYIESFAIFILAATLLNALWATPRLTYYVLELATTLHQEPSICSSFSYLCLSPSSTHPSLKEVYVTVRTAWRTSCSATNPTAVLDPWFPAVRGHPVA